MLCINYLSNFGSPPVMTRFSLHPVLPHADTKKAIVSSHRRKFINARSSSTAKEAHISLCPQLLQTQTTYFQSMLKYMLKRQNYCRGGTMNTTKKGRNKGFSPI